MAHTKSALKRIRQTETRTVRNRAAISRIRTLRKKLDVVVATGDAAAVSEVYNQFSSAVDKAAKTGKMPANRASNYKSKAAKTVSKQTA